MRRRSAALCAAAVLAALTTASCIQAGRPTGAPGATAALTLAHARPATIGFADAPAPDLQAVDLALPAGCIVEDYTDDLAAYSQRPDPSRTTDSLGLLDLTDGRHAVVRSEAVNAEMRWDVFSPRLSNSVMAWEEVTPGEGDDMGHAGWRLYAAPIDRAALTLGAPVLVAQGRTETTQRPFYGVDDTTVYWTLLATPTAPLEGAQEDEVRATDLASGAVRTLRRSPVIDGFKLSSGAVVVTESRSGRLDSPDAALSATAIRASDGGVLRSVALGNANPLSHFADYADGWFVWTEPTQEGGEPFAYVMDPRGNVSLAALRAMNPMVSPGYAFAECRESSGSPTALRDVRVLRGFDLAAHTRFDLVRTAADEEGVWHTTVAGSRPGTLVIYNDSWVLTGTDRTPVRVYRW
jgi:hypothetical protein